MHALKNGRDAQFMTASKGAAIVYGRGWGGTNLKIARTQNLPPSITAHYDYAPLQTCAQKLVGVWGESHGCGRSAFNLWSRRVQMIFISFSTTPPK